ncbi:hypothetical protein JCM8208_006547 [Rhodotorula glutinis]
MSSLVPPLNLRPRSSSTAAHQAPPPSSPAPAPPPPAAAQLGDAHDPAATRSLVMDGWLLKKKRKKMQGMARRYFRLAGNGALSYAFSPTSPLRDSIFVSLAFISASRKHRTFHIDGGTTVYHCKALTLDDFDKWAAALKQFIPVAQVSSGDAEHAHGLVSNMRGVNLGGGAAPQRDDAVEKVLDALGKLNQPIADIEMLANELRQADPSQHQAPPPQPQQHLIPPTQGSPQHSQSNGGSKFRFLGKRSNSTSMPNGARSPSFSGSHGAVHGQPPPLNLNVGAPGSSVSGTTMLSSSPTFDDAFENKPSSASSSSQGNDALLRQLSGAIATLKHQHAQLALAVRALPATPASPASPTSAGGSSSSDLYGSARATSPSSAPLAGGVSVLTGPYASRSAAGFYPSHTRGAPSRASSRASFSSMWSDGASDDWHDAMAAVPGEFVDEDSVVRGAGAGAGDEAEGRESSPERERSTVGEGASTVDEDEDEDSGGETEDEAESDREAAEVEAAERRVEGAGEQGTPRGADAAAAALQSGQDVKRRSQLPAPVSGDEFSMLSMLRKNVGKDLSTISFPVTMNEPLSALQRVAEELEYSELLDRAAQATDPTERLTLVAVWAVSGASSNKFRGSRKPFNPLLGETYECIRPDKGFRFISEKVSHHPPVIAFLGDAPERGWQICGYTSPSTKFWGRSMEIFVEGEFCVRFADNNEVITIRKPSSFVRNLVAGTKYLEVVGDLVVTTSLSSAQATVAFKEGSTWGGLSGRNKIEGKVTDASGSVVVELVGRWDDAVDKKEGKNNFSRLWQVAEFPPNPERYYGFSRFAVTLNETTTLEEGLVAPTDSRLRPDQLAFERGDIDEAERVKALVEEKQRTKRKEGRAAEPRWFKQAGENGWEYGGEYFEAREKKSFEDPDIFT